MHARLGCQPGQEAVDLVHAFGASKGTRSRRLPYQAIGVEDERLDEAKEGSGERRDDAGRFEVRAVAPTIAN